MAGATAGGQEGRPGLVFRLVPAHHGKNPLRQVKFHYNPGDQHHFPCWEIDDYPPPSEADNKAFAEWLALSDADRSRRVASAKKASLQNLRDDLRQFILTIP